jgi:isopentenyl phosphate kinase
MPPPAEVSATKELVFVKFGGSVITDKTKPYTVNFPSLRMLCKEVVMARKEGIKLIVGHGGGSFPHTSAEKYRTQDGFIDENSLFGFCKVGMDAAKLNAIVVDEFLKIGEKAFTLRVSTSAIAKNGRIYRWDIEAAKHLLKMDVLPVTYGDVIADVEKEFTIVPTEEIFRFLAEKLKPRKVILVSKYAVHDSDPEKNQKAGKVDRIDRKELELIKRGLSGSHGFDVTGGMLRKVELAIEIAKHAGEVEIISSKQGNLLQSIRGEHVGTMI